MKTRFMKKVQTILIWFCVWSLSLTVLLGVNLSHAKAFNVLPTVEFVKSNDSGLESTLNPLIQVTLDSSSTKDVTVNCAVDTTNTTANSSDYSLLPSMTISADNTTDYLPLQITNNAKVDGDRVVVIDLESPSEATLGSQSEFTYTISDDDQSLTTLTTDISANSDDWFNVVPEVTLTSNISNLQFSTWYQWNGKIAGNWQRYDKPFKTSIEGENTLYFRTLDTIDDLGNILFDGSGKINIDTVKPQMTTVSATLASNNQVQLSWNAVIDADHYDIYRDGKLIATLWNGQVSYVDQQITVGQNYPYKVIAVDIAGNQSLEQAASIFVPNPVIITPIITPVQIEPVAPVVIQPVVTKKIGTGISTSVAQTAPEPTVTPQVQGESQVIDTPKDTEDTPTESRNWNKLLLIISILIIAAGVATGGYYGYEWYMNRKDDGTGDSNPKNKSRW